MAIPKIVHWCWLSGDPLPDLVQQCQSTWRHWMPDWELRLWDRDRFSIDMHPFVAEAFRHKKYAFAADYIRLHALYVEGGLYLDSDVLLRQRLMIPERARAFSAVEHHPNIALAERLPEWLDESGRRRENCPAVPGIGIQAAVMASEAGHPWIKACLEHYADRHFVKADGSLDIDPIAPTIFAQKAEAFGFVYRNEVQQLDSDLHLASSRQIAPTKGSICEESVAAHMCAGSWQQPPQLMLRQRVSRKFRKIFS